MHWLHGFNLTPCETHHTQHLCVQKFYICACGLFYSPFRGRQRKVLGYNRIHQSRIVEDLYVNTIPVEDKTHNHTVSNTIPLDIFWIILRANFNM
jgi:hypothetical protein